MERTTIAAAGLALGACLVGAYAGTPVPEQADETVATAAPTAPANPTAPATTAPTANPSPNPNPEPTPEPTPTPTPAIAVAITPDPTRAGAATIGPDGGALTATGADGTAYSLDVPAGALTSPVALTMTPVAALAGAPVQALVGAVTLAPEDLALGAAATLTVTPATPGAAGVGAQAGFCVGPGMGGFHLSGLAADQAARLPLIRLGTCGVADTTREQRAQIAESTPAGPDAAFQNAVARDLLDLRRAAVRGLPADADARARVDAALAAYYDDQVLPALEDPDADLATVVQATSYVEEHRVLGAADDARTADARSRVTALLATLLDRELAACSGGATSGTPGDPVRVLTLARQLRRADPTQADARTAAVRACARVEVAVDTSLTDRWDYASPAETHRLRARWELASASAGPAPGGGGGSLDYAGFDYDQRVTSECGGADLVARWRADRAASTSGRLSWRLRVDTNLRVGGAPSRGPVGEVELRVVRVPRDALSAATYAACGQVRPDRFPMTVTYGAERWVALHADTGGRVTVPLSLGPDAGGLAGSRTFRLAEPGIDRETVQDVEVRVTPSPA